MWLKTLNSRLFLSFEFQGKPFGQELLGFGQPHSKECSSEGQVDGKSFLLLCNTQSAHKLTHSSSNWWPLISNTITHFESLQGFTATCLSVDFIWHYFGFEQLDWIVLFIPQKINQNVMANTNTSYLEQHTWFDHHDYDNIFINDILSCVNCLLVPWGRFRWENSWLNNFRLNLANYITHVLLQYFILTASLTAFSLSSLITSWISLRSSVPMPRSSHNMNPRFTDISHTGMASHFFGLNPGGQWW